LKNQNSKKKKNTILKDKKENFKVGDKKFIFFSKLRDKEMDFFLDLLNN